MNIMCDLKLQFRLCFVYTKQCVDPCMTVACPMVEKSITNNIFNLIRLVYNTEMIFNILKLQWAFIRTNT